jgi:hypothetical protein
VAAALVAPDAGVVFLQGLYGKSLFRQPDGTVILQDPSGGLGGHLLLTIIDSYSGTIIPIEPSRKVIRG